MKERLTELLKKADKNTANKMITDYEDAIKDNADYLIANGVVIIDLEKYPPFINRGLIDQIMGTPLDEMANLIKAKREGQMIMPPCKIGDVLFCIVSNKSCTDDKVYQHIEACRVEAIMFFGEDCFLYSIKEINNGYRHNTKLGKDAFRTFEEAEIVLSKRRGT